MILLQVECIELKSRKVTFEECFEGLNIKQYYCIVKPIEGSRDHQQWLEGLVNPFIKTDRVDYIAATVKHILKFFKIEWGLDWNSNFLPLNRCMLDFSSSIYSKNEFLL